MSDNALFFVVTEALLKRRLRNMTPIEDGIFLSPSPIITAEYQFFIYEIAREKKYYTPDHWTQLLFESGDARKPILGVRPKDAEAFCKWLTQRDGLGIWNYRLPTESEAMNYLKGNINFWVKDSGNCKLIKHPDIAKYITSSKNLSDNIEKLFILDLEYLPLLIKEIARKTHEEWYFEINKETYDEIMVKSYLEDINPLVKFVNSLQLDLTLETNLETDVDFLERESRYDWSLGFSTDAYMGAAVVGLLIDVGMSAWLSSTTLPTLNGIEIYRLAFALGLVIIPIICMLILFLISWCAEIITNFIKELTGIPQIDAAIFEAFLNSVEKLRSRELITKESKTALVEERQKARVLLFYFILRYSGFLNSYRVGTRLKEIRNKLQQFVNLFAHLFVIECRSNGEIPALETFYIVRERKRPE